jgi:glycosyltransferase involved in cell wall biosynthesis
VGHTTINDRRVNLRPLARWAYEVLPRPIARVFAFALGRVDDLVNRLPYLIALVLLVLRVRPDIIHGNNEPFSNREAMIVARLFRRPYVQHVRGPYPRITQYKALLDGPRYFIPVSRWLAEELAKDGVHPARIRQIYDAVKVPQPSGVQTPAAYSTGKLTVAMVGMLMPWKGQALFIDAAQQLAGERPDLHFIVVGGVPERGDPEYQRSLHMAGRALLDTQRLEFLGHRGDVLELLRRVDVVVSASLEPEPLGLVMLEALAQGAEFVGPAHGAAVEVLQRLGTGTLFEPGSASGLARAILQAVQKREREVPSPNVARALEEVFSPQRCAELTSRVYRGCLASGSY